MIDVILNGKVIELPPGDECGSLAAAKAQIQDFVAANK